MPINSPLPGNATSAINRQLPQNFSVPGLQQQGLYQQNPYGPQGGPSQQGPSSQYGGISQGTYSTQMGGNNPIDINPTPGGPLSVPPPPYSFPHTGYQGQAPGQPPMNIPYQMQNQYSGPPQYQGNQGSPQGWNQGQPQAGPPPEFRWR